MKKVFRIIAAAAVVLGLFPQPVHAYNPIIQTNYTADPAPMVYNDTVYLYTSHDEDDAVGFKMNEWMCYTSSDMVNWTDHGVVASLETFEWASHSAWAPQCVERNGKFYLYCPVGLPYGQTYGEYGDGAMTIGVAVADSPLGPFKDAIGKPLIPPTGGFDIDPTVFIDDDGQAWLYWGNGALYGAMLNDDMTSIKTELPADMQLPEGVEFKDGVFYFDMPEDYEEGPWIYKRGDIYYMTYASHCCPEGIGYCMGNSPLGPWTDKGDLMAGDSRSSGNHPGIIDYKGKTYCFGFNKELLRQETDENYERRSVCVEEMKFNADGSIKVLDWWSDKGAVQIANLDPYVENEAETIAWSSGLKTEVCVNGGMNIRSVDDGDYIMVSQVDFGSEGAGSFSAEILAAGNAGFTGNSSIELRLDSMDGTLIGTVPVSYTKGQWKTETAGIQNATGIHDLYFVFRGEDSGDLLKFDSWKFEKKTSEKNLVAVNAYTDKYKIDTIDGHKTAELTVTAVYSDGTREDVTADAQVICADSGIVEVGSGNKTITALSRGEEMLTVTYNGKTDTVPVLVTDLTAELGVLELKLSESELTLNIGRTASITVTAVHSDGREEDVTETAEFAINDQNIASLSDNSVTGKAYGNAVITVSYTPALGDTKTVELPVEVTGLLPYEKVEAEYFTQQQGIQTEECGEGTLDIGYVHDGDWLKYGDVNFGDEGTEKFIARVASTGTERTMEIRLDSLDGKLVGTLEIPNTGGFQNWKTALCKTTEKITGIHDVYLKFGGGASGDTNLNWWRFGESNVTDQNLLYFVDCGDHDVTTLTGDDKFGIYNSVTDKVYGADPITGKQWGVDDPNGNESGGAGLKNDSGVYTAYTWANENDQENSSAKDNLDKNETFRYARNQDSNGINPRYVTYRFEVDSEDGIYPVEVGMKNHWGGDNNPAVYANYGTDSQITLAEDMNISQGETKVAKGEVQAKDGYITIDARSESATLNMTYIKIGAEEAEEIPVTEVILNVEKIDLEPGEEYQLTAEVRPENATDKSITWSSDNDEVAVVDQNGKVTAIQEGTAVITALPACKCPNLAAECVVNVKAASEEVSLTGLEVKAPVKTKYKVGEELSTEGMIVKALYSDESSTELTSDQYTLTGFSSDTAGTKTVTVSYTENGVTKTASFNVIVEKEQTQIPIDKTALAAKLEEAKAIGPDGVTEESYEVLQNAIFEAEEVYNDPDASQDAVNRQIEKLISAISGLKPLLSGLEITGPDKTEYTVGEKLNTAGLKVTAVYSDGTTVVLTDDQYTVTGFDSEEAGEKQVMVSYTENGVTETAEFTVTVEPGEEPGKEPDKEPGRDPSGNPDKDPETDTTVSESVQTGDKLSILPAVTAAVMAVSAGTAVITVKYRKKRR